MDGNSVKLARIVFDLLLNTNETPISSYSLYKWRHHIYIIGHYNTSVRIIGLVSHTTYVVVFVNFIRE